jgi:hypothetical protein
MILSSGGIYTKQEIITLHSDSTVQFNHQVAFLVNKATIPYRDLTDKQYLTYNKQIQNMYLP